MGLEKYMNVGQVLYGEGDAEESFIKPKLAAERGDSIV
ncbi:unnamed protein product [Arabidopsis halleri]